MPSRRASVVGSRQRLVSCQSLQGTVVVPQIRGRRLPSRLRISAVAKSESIRSLWPSRAILYREIHCPLSRRQDVYLFQLYGLYPRTLSLIPTTAPSNVSSVCGGASWRYRVRTVTGASLGIQLNIGSASRNRFFRFAFHLISHIRNSTMSTTIFAIVTATFGMLANSSDSIDTKSTCCIKHAYCCTTKLSCCPTDSEVIVSEVHEASMVARTSDEVSELVCCVKNAYCCSSHRRCCRKVSLTSIEVISNTRIASDELAAGRPTCCIKNAYCCTARRSCCG